MHEKIPTIIKYELLNVYLLSAGSHINCIDFKYILWLDDDESVFSEGKKSKQIIQPYLL